MNFRVERAKNHPTLAQLMLNTNFMKSLNKYSKIIDKSFNGPCKIVKENKKIELGNWGLQNNVYYCFISIF